VLTTTKERLELW